MQLDIRDRLGQWYEEENGKEGRSMEIQYPTFGYHGAHHSARWAGETCERGERGDYGFERKGGEQWEDK